MKNFRFRNGCLGSLILQVRDDWEEDGQKFSSWRDAKPSDLALYYEQLFALTQAAEEASAK